MSAKSGAWPNASPKCAGAKITAAKSNSNIFTTQILRTSLKLLEKKEAASSKQRFYVSFICMINHIEHRQ